MSDEAAEDWGVGEGGGGERYANKHIARVLHGKYPSVLDEEGRKVVQVVSDGRKLTAAALRSGKDPLTLERPILVTDDAQRIGMRLPVGGLTVRDVGEKLGMDHPVIVMDVRLQEELTGWTLRDLVEYFDSDERNVYAPKSEGGATATAATTAAAASDAGKEESGGGSESTTSLSLSSSSLSSSPPPRRTSRRKPKASAKKRALEEGPLIINQISLEFSRTALEKEVRSPQFVRDLDWIDNVWPPELKRSGDFPVVQYYCLTSPAGCYTDFHIDFGGSSVWYHVISGQKVFLLVPPSRPNLAAFEAWLCREDQSNVFFLDQQPPPNVQSPPAEDAAAAPAHVTGAVRVTLDAGQTMVIPTGWIHAVYTPADSLVIGGNFLHGLDIGGQLDVYGIETRTHVRPKFRFPHFIRIMFYAGAVYLKRMRRKYLCKAEWDGVERLIAMLRQWTDRRNWTDAAISQTLDECPAKAGCASLEEMLDQMTAELGKKRSNANQQPHLDNDNDDDDENDAAETDAAVNGGGFEKRPTLRLNLSKLKPPAAAAAPIVTAAADAAAVDEMVKSPAKIRSSSKPRQNGGDSDEEFRAEEDDDDDDDDDDMVQGEEEDVEFHIHVPPSAMGLGSRRSKKRRSSVEPNDLEPYRNGVPDDDGEWLPAVPTSSINPNKKRLSVGKKKAAAAATTTTTTTATSSQETGETTAETPAPVVQAAIARGLPAHRSMAGKVVATPQQLPQAQAQAQQQQQQYACARRPSAPKQISQVANNKPPRRSSSSSSSSTSVRSRLSKRLGI